MCVCVPFSSFRGEYNQHKILVILWAARHKACEGEYYLHIWHLPQSLPFAMPHMHRSSLGLLFKSFLSLYLSHSLSKHLKFHFGFIYIPTICLFAVKIIKFYRLEYSSIRKWLLCLIGTSAARGIWGQGNQRWICRNTMRLFVVIMDLHLSKHFILNSNDILCNLRILFVLSHGCKGEHCYWVLGKNKNLKFCIVTVGVKGIV